MAATPLSRTRRDRALAPLPEFPLLDATDLPGDDDWALPGVPTGDDGAFDDDRYATLSVARSFDD